MFLKITQEKNLDNLGCTDVFLDSIPKTGSMKEIIDELDITKIKHFCSTKDTVKSEKTTLKVGEDTPGKVLLSKIHKELLKFKNKKENDPIKKMGKNPNRYLIKEDKQMASKHVRCSTSYGVRYLINSEIP